MKIKKRVCPKCECEIVARIHRKFAEKILTRKNKYRCADCKSEFFRRHGLRG